MRYHNLHSIVRRSFAILLFGLVTRTAVLHAQGNSIPAPVGVVLKAAFGVGQALPGSSMVITLDSSPFYPGVRFFRGFQAGVHGDLHALAVEIPGLGIMPLGSSAVRRLLDPYLHVDVSDSASMLRYSLELARFDGRVPIDAQMVESIADLPSRLVEVRGLDSVSPSIRDEGGNSMVHMYLTVQGHWLYEVYVQIAAGERWKDQVVISRFLWEY